MSTANFNEYKSFNIVIKGVRLTCIVSGGINIEEKKQKKDQEKSIKKKKN